MTLSRVANNLYWLSRYVERAESYARFLEANLQFELDLPGGFEIQPMIQTTGDMVLFEKLYKEKSTDNAIRFMVFEKENPNSIYSCISQAREIARTVRENLSSDAWQQLNTFYLELKEAFEKKSDNLYDAPAFFEAVKQHSQLFQGILDSTVTRDTAWEFLRLGRFIERADKITRILDLKYYVVLPSVDDVGTPIDLMLWATILKSASAYQMFHRHSAEFSDGGIVDFLLLERRFPRSLLFCLDQVCKSISRYNTTRAYGLASDLYAQCIQHDAHVILERGLHEYLDRMQANINQLGKQIYTDFFALK